MHKELCPKAKLETIFSDPEQSYSSHAYC